MSELNRERLVQLLGMFGASAVGERANAASLADSLVRRAGLTWAEVLEGINVDGPRRRDVSDDVVNALNGEIERYHNNVSRLERELETVRGEVRRVTEQLERERESANNERSAWSAERDALHKTRNAEQSSERKTKRWGAVALVLTVAAGITAFAYYYQLEIPSSEQWRALLGKKTVVPKPIGAPHIETVVRKPIGAPRIETVVRKPIGAPEDARIELDLANSKIELVDDSYVLRGELFNSGRAAGSTSTLKMIFRKGDDVLGERAYSMIEGPIAPGGRLSFSLPFDDPPDGTTNIVPSVE
jgi:hypothetical protein